MSGPRDTRESAEEAGTAAVPADSVPPSFGGAVPPADAPSADEAPSAEEAESTASAMPRLPAFGLEAPWWAAESTDTAPPAEDAPVEDVDDEVVFGADEPAEEDSPAPEATGIELGTLVAGVGVPSIDSRRAVPAEPIVKRPLAFGDTDPDGFPAVHPEEDAEEGEPAAEEAAADTAVDDEPEEAAEAAPEPAPPADTDTSEEPLPSAFEKAKEAEDAAPAAPLLVPDAILPPGVVPPTGSGPFPQGETAEGAAATAEQAAVITPVYHAEGGVPIDTPPPPGRPPQGGPKGGGDGNLRRPLLIGGVAAVILAAVVALFTVGGSGSSGGQGDETKADESPAATQTSPATTPAPTSTPIDITNEKTDTEDLSFRDVFPTKTIQLGGRNYTLDRWSLNREVAYAARGAMLRTLKREQCRKIVRATYIDRGNSLAVTSGIAVMPTKEAALKVSKAGNPAQYEWFRGMAGKHAPNLDRAGGYAAATVRGRYVAYAYVQWANGKKAKPGDPTIKRAAQLFLDHDLRPIIARTRG